MPRAIGSIGHEIEWLRLPAPLSMQERKQIEWSARMKGVAALEKSERQRYEVTAEEMKNKEDLERKLLGLNEV